MQIRGGIRLVGIWLSMTMYSGVVLTQTVTGTLSGHVIDATGGAMPGVKVSAKNQQTGLQREGVGAPTGSVKPPLQPGRPP